jgi:putative FmdB family regulatory protein
MPVYSLLCESCGKMFDVAESLRVHEQHMNKHDLPCPNCGSTRLQPQLGILAVKTSKKS